MTATTTTAPQVSSFTPPSGEHLAVQLPARDLLREVRFAGFAIARRPVVPVLAGVLLQAHAGGLQVSGYDYATSATSLLPAAGARGEAVLPAVLLQQMLALAAAGADE